MIRSLYDCSSGRGRLCGRDTSGDGVTGTVHRLVLAEPRAIAGAVRSARRRGVLQPADRPAPSDRVLRRPPAGLQLQHAREDGARRRRASTPRLETLFARGIDPSEDRRPDGAAAHVSGPSRDDGAAVRRRGRPPRARGAGARRSRSPGRSAARPRRGGVHDPRARGDAPGDAALHVASPAARAEAAAAGYRPRRRGRACRAQEWIDDSRRPRHARRRRDALPFGWDNERPHSPPTSPHSRIERHNVTNADFLEFVEAGGYATRWWRRDWLVVERSTRVLGAHDAWYWRGMFELHPAAAVVAGLREPRGGHARMRGGADARLPTEAEFQRAAYGTPDGSERAYPWGERAPVARARRLRLLELGSRAGRHASRRPQRLGRRRSRRQRLGVDEHGVRAVSRASGRCPPIRSTPPTSSTASTSS